MCTLYYYYWNLTLGQVLIDASSLCFTLLLDGTGHYNNYVDALPSLILYPVHSSIFCRNFLMAALSLSASSAHWWRLPWASCNWWWRRVSWACRRFLPTAKLECSCLMCWLSDTVWYTKECDNKSLIVNNYNGRYTALMNLHP